MITCPDLASADALASHIVASHSAACVNLLGGLTSIYRWKGEVCRDSEVLLLVKTTEQKREAVAAAVTELHPYDEPELIFLPFHSGSRSYLRWLGEQTQS